MGGGQFYTYDINDPRDRIVDIVESAQQSNAKDIISAHEFAKELRKFHWDNRRITNHGTYVGGEEYQWAAHIPGKLAELLDRRHPGWCDSEESLQEILKLYPECNVLPDVRRNA